MRDVIPEQVDSWGISRGSDVDINAFRVQKANTLFNNKQRKLMNAHDCWDCRYFNTERCAPSSHCFHQLHIKEPHEI